MPPDGELQRLLSSLVRYRVVQFGLSLKCPVCRRSIKVAPCRPAYLHHGVSVVFVGVSVSGAWRRIGGKVGIQVGWSLFHRRARRGRPICPRDVWFLSLLTGVGSHYAVTPTLSIGVSKDGQCFELDFVAFVRDTDIIGIEDTKELFGECKSFNDFAEIDIRRMKNVVERFSPDGVILFSTLKKSCHQKRCPYSLMSPRCRLVTESIPYHASWC